ncbi:ThiF family adenylyltransferase [Candidatus Woesearchaeota archaeon]|nr:ThiF family adenylyltransferase [Candidatus Woesearchaeota archaeon]
MASMVSRYNRQELLSFVGVKGQRKLSESTVTVFGMGALGTVAAEILARSGVGKLVVVDRDVVELTDLQRQLMYDESDIGKPKASAAAAKLEKINSEIKIVPVAADADYKNIMAVVGKPDVILDCTDNLETRFLINEYCLKNKLAWVHAAAIRESSQLMVFDFRNGGNNLPCFACVFGASSAAETCDTVGVLASATIAVAAMQATEALKILVGKENEKVKGLLRLNAWQNKMTEIAVKKNKKCCSCGNKGTRTAHALINPQYEYLSGKKGSKMVSLCGRNSYQIKGNAVDLEKLKKRLQRIGEKVADFGECISFRNITLFRDGRALIKAGSAEEAKASYSSYVGS